LRSIRRIPNPKTRTGPLLKFSVDICCKMSSSEFMMLVTSPEPEYEAPTPEPVSLPENEDEEPRLPSPKHHFVHGMYIKIK